MAPPGGPPKKSAGQTRDLILVLVGVLCASPLLLLPSRPSFPRAGGGWAGDASHVHAGAATIGAVGPGSIGGGGGGGSGGGAPGHIPPSLNVASSSSSSTFPGGPAGASSAAAVADPDPRLHHICRDSDPAPPADIKYDLISALSPEEDRARFPSPVDCHWAPLRHPSVPLRPFNVCTHDPATDKVISTFLHKFNFWDAPDTYNLLLAAGPCTKERPYMLDIGANLGLWTLVSVSQGCRAVSFEPLSGNILRLRESLRAMGLEKSARLYKHAVGKRHGSVSINFFAANPGASAIGGGGGAGMTTETVGLITVDGLLLGHGGIGGSDAEAGSTTPNAPPTFRDAASPATASLPPVVGRHVAWAKIDTEGWDVAVLDGAMRTLVGGKVPLIMIEFTPSDAQGTAGCSPVRFVELMYANGYRMYAEGGRVHRLASLVRRDVPRAAEGVGARVFEVFFIRDGAAVDLMAKGVLEPFPDAGAAKDALVRPWTGKKGGD